VRCSRDVGTIDADVYSSAGKAGAKSGSEIQVRARVGESMIFRVRVRLKLWVRLRVKMLV
jgi:uncharacterized membrane protein affecting hemolysin expression